MTNDLIVNELVCGSNDAMEFSLKSIELSRSDLDHVLEQSHFKACIHGNGLLMEIFADKLADLYLVSNRETRREGFRGLEILERSFANTDSGLKVTNRV